MKTEMATYEPTRGWAFAVSGVERASFVLYFASKEAVGCGAPLQGLMARFPSATIVGCSTGGEITGRDARDGSIVAVAVELEGSRVELATRRVEESARSERAGRELGLALAATDLRALLVFADRTRVDGNELVRGLRDSVAAGVVVCGGLAGDGDRFDSTWVGVGDRREVGIVAALGLYGDRLTIGTGSEGGWEAFGPERIVTRSFGSTLYELDGEPALDLYKRYLGGEATRLPASALRYPLSVQRDGGQEATIVRTVVGVSDLERTMSFAGDIPQGSVVRLMRGSLMRLIEGAERAARATLRDGPAPEEGGLALLVSCIGRKLMMGQRVTDEVEVVAGVLGARFHTVGFYSYGEISPHPETGRPELHNQTMTVTTIGERK